MSAFEFDVDGAMNELERLAREVPDAIPQTLDAMCNILVPKLRSAAPVDIANTEGKHLKDLIGKSTIRYTKRGTPYRLVFITKRSVKGKDDRHVYKAVVAEYGRDGYGGNGVKKDGTPSKIPNPFWRKTVIAAQDEMIAAGRKVIEETIENIKKG